MYLPKVDCKHFFFFNSMKYVIHTMTFICNIIQDMTDEQRQPFIDEAIRFDENQKTAAEEMEFKTCLQLYAEDNPHFEDLFMAKIYFDDLPEEEEGRYSNFAKRTYIKKNKSFCK